MQVCKCKIPKRHTHTNALSLGLLLHLFSVKHIFLEIFSLSKTRHQHAISRLNGLHLHTATHNTHSCRIYRLVGLACGFLVFFHFQRAVGYQILCTCPKQFSKKKIIVIIIKIKTVDFTCSLLCWQHTKLACTCLHMFLFLCNWMSI